MKPRMKVTPLDAHIALCELKALASKFVSQHIGSGQGTTPGDMVALCDAGREFFELLQPGISDFEMGFLMSALCNNGNVNVEGVNMVHA